MIKFDERRGVYLFSSIKKLAIGFLVLSLSILPCKVFADDSELLLEDAKILKEINFDITSGFNLKKERESTFDDKRTVTGVAEEGTMVTMYVYDEAVDGVAIWLEQKGLEEQLDEYIDLTDIKEILEELDDLEVSFELKYCREIDREFLDEILDELFDKKDENFEKIEELFERLLKELEFLNENMYQSVSFCVEEDTYGLENVCVPSSEPVSIYKVNAEASGIFSQSIELEVGDNTVVLVFEKEGYKTEIKQFSITRKNRNIKEALENGIVLPGENLLFK